MTAEKTLKSFVQLLERDVNEFVAQRAVIIAECSKVPFEPDDEAEHLMLANKLQTHKLQLITKQLTKRAEQLLSDWFDEEKRGTSLRVELQSDTELFADGICGRDSLTTESCSRSTSVHNLKSVASETECATMCSRESLDLVEHFRLLKVKLQVVVDLLRDDEHSLHASFFIPTSLMEAEQLERDYRKFQKSLAKTQETVELSVQTAQLLLQSIANKQTRGCEVLYNGNPNGVSLESSQCMQNLVERVTASWQQLVSHAEERRKLVVASFNWYRTKEQVFSMLNLLLQQYQRPDPDDWLSTAATNMDEKLHQLRVSKMQHLEQKEAVFKACALARKTADSFSNHPVCRFMSAASEADGSPSWLLAVMADQSAKVSRSLEQLSEVEKTVLDAWFLRNKRLDQLLIMTELLNTECTYVKYLETCIKAYLKALTDDETSRLVPAELQGQERVIFINLEAIFYFHKNTFLPELENCKSRPKDVAACFVNWHETLTTMYAECGMGLEKSSNLIATYGSSFFKLVQNRHQLQLDINSYLIKPAQRISNYQLLLNEVKKTLVLEQVGDMNEALEKMLNVRKRVNAAVHLSNAVTSEDGHLLLLDTFTAWNSKDRKDCEQLVLLLFENCLLFAKECHERYMLKMRYDLLSVCNGITECFKEDPCKFAIWVYTGSANDQHRVELEAGNSDTKQQWVIAIREACFRCTEKAINDASAKMPVSEDQSPRKKVAAASFRRKPK